MGDHSSVAEDELSFNCDESKFIYAPGQGSVTDFLRYDESPFIPE
jgi:hypothetical protein